MRELHSISKAYRILRQAGKRFALATVLQVQGSSYRQPGARMLITEDGEIFGSVSGGCLERDLIYHARVAFQLSEARLQIYRYDTTEDGEEYESLSSVSLGCQGVIDIGLEVLSPEEPHPILEGICATLDQQLEISIATVISSPRECPIRPGSYLIRWPNQTKGSLHYDAFEAQVLSDLQSLQENTIKLYPLSNLIDKRYDSQLSLLLEKIRPPRPWIIFGAGHDSLPLAEFGQILGWNVTVVDCRSSYSLPHRFFSKVDQLIQCQPNEVGTKLNLTSNTLCALVTHNYFHDREIIRQLLPSPVAYIGLLGPKRKGISILEDLNQSGLHFNLAQLERFHSPAGIDTGAEDPHGVALSIIAEAAAVAAHRPGGFLRERNGPIHLRKNT